MSETNIIDFDIIGDYIKYYCKISKSSIIFKLKENTIILYNTEFEWSYPKLILHLIKYAFLDISDKYKNVKYYKYTISVSELDFIDKTKFSQKYDENNENVELLCDINNAYEYFISGFLI